MQLDTQVEESPPAANPEHKHKHRKKDKHKHKHHKKSKRDRHDPSGSALPDEEAVETAEDQVAGIGVEDGELPGPPVAEGGLQPSSVSNAADVHAAQQPADRDSNLETDVQELRRKRRPATELQAEDSKRSRLDKSGVPGQSASVHPDLPVLDALVSQPDINDVVDSSTVLPVPDSATAHEGQRSKEHRSAAEQPKTRQHDAMPADSAADPLQTASSDRHRLQDRPHESNRHSDSHKDSHRSDRHGSHRSSSRRPEDSSHHRSHSQRPSDNPDQLRQRDRPREEARTESRSRHKPTEAQGRRSERQAQDARPSSRSDVRDSSRSRHTADARARGHSRDQYRERYRDHADDRRHGSDRRGPSAGRDRRYDSHRESDSHREKRKRAEKEEEEKEFVAKVEAALQATEVDEDQLIEERRRRRQQILAKHQQEQQAAQGPAGPSSDRSASPATSRPFSTSPQPSSVPQSSVNGHAAPVSPAAHADSAQAAADSAVARQESTANAHVASDSAANAHVDADSAAAPAHVGTALATKAHVDVLAELPAEALIRGGAESPSISDDEQYQKLDGDLWQQGQGSGQLEGAPRPAGTLVAPDVEPEVHQAEIDDRKVPREAAEEAKEAVAATAAAAGADAGAGLDMFADNVDADMFAETPMVAASAAPAKKALLDNYDDAEGYYNFQVGEIMDGRYEVFATHGKGVFSTVLRARDQKTGNGAEVAIKMIRANETMYKAAQTEKVVLRKLSGADPEGRRHCIRLMRTFDYRGHLCLVFEAMDINLRELTKKYGRGIGLNIAAVSKYSAQMLISLYHLRNCGVLHADIKPDNILVSTSRTMVKLADFGSAMFSGDNEITPYLVSRFYRAPEVILGLKYDHALDIWSVGCVIYELFTGKILFPGKTNNEMLKLIMDVKGPFPKKMLKKGAFADRHFEDDPNMSFAMLEEDAVTRRPIRRTIAAPHIKKDFAGLLAGSEGERKKVAQLADLLERMMALDPDKRISPKDALKHPFIKEPKV